jgi:hypothetical protein
MAIFLYFFALSRIYSRFRRALTGINARTKICVPLINSLPGKNCLAGKK